MAKDPDDPGTIEMFPLHDPMRQGLPHPKTEESMPRFSDYSGSPYMKATELTPMGKHYPATIKQIVEELVGREEEKKLVAYLTDPGNVFRKPIPLNAGNRDALMAAFGDDTDECAGKQVEVWTELVALGTKMVPGFKFATAKPAEGGSLLPDDSVPW